MCSQTITQFFFVVLSVIQPVAMCVVLRMHCNFRIQDLHWRATMVQSLGIFFLVLRSAFLAHFFSLTVTAVFPFVPISFVLFQSSANSSGPYLHLCYFSLLAFFLSLSVFVLSFISSSAWPLLCPVLVSLISHSLSFFSLSCLHYIPDLSNLVVSLTFLVLAFVSSLQFASHNFIPFSCLCCYSFCHISLLLFCQFILSYMALGSYALQLLHHHHHHVLEGLGMFPVP
jgi:hypothetical protein